MDSGDYFRNKGWQVGQSPSGDLCPTCVEAAAQAKRKVVKMADHPKGPKIVHEEAAAERVMSKEEGRILIFTIADHWDDQRKRYQQGWSDVRIGNESGVPAAWVTTIRERDFGGTGIDPGFEIFLEDMVAIKAEMSSLGGLLTQATEVYKNGSLLHSGLQEALVQEGKRLDEITRQLDGYKNAHGRLFAKVTKLSETAEALAPAVKKAVG